jgi:tRNA A37 threonylcarbamoyladenosine biosynthesis protein TsaE
MARGKLSPTEVIIRELERFLESKEPEVICIRGRWGVGKTHAWNEAIKAVNARHKLGSPQNWW